MTNQEAINKLTAVLNDDIYSWSPDILTAFDMAVDALKGADGDYISRAEAINALCDEYCGGWQDCKYYPKCENLKAIQNLPSAQPERKTGRWIERNPQNSPDCRLIECSECGNAYIVGYDIDYDDWIDGRNFCMKCGADLRGGSNGKST